MPRRAKGRQTVGAFDIRNFIGFLLGLYGLILLLMGLFGDKELYKTGDVNANLYTGIALVVVCIVFLAWARWKPIIMPADAVEPGSDPDRPEPAATADPADPPAPPSGRGPRD